MIDDDEDGWGDGEDETQWYNINKNDNIILFNIILLIK